MPKGRFDIVSMYDDIDVRVGDTQVVDALVNCLTNLAERAFFFRAERRGRHHVNRHRVWSVAFRGIKDLSILLARLLWDVLGCQE